ncbi:CYFA0S05e00386g1_1 [Cyberlindnera fabianii]|uniref:CYFA0S05e00386g1_1 n=1 Tax=Cyberlindnera fabianii TaxID=36022 RepID=A0A061AS57_CYBFA|nr:Peroxisomal membrane protein 4 [Cyberlindnera fabianii]CDR40411.1 CYFA0S05e00386g1_1 [Cyberlindnera fabianii]
MDEINKLIANPQYRPFFQILKSMRNGIEYGGKLRFAHTLVMQAIFKRNTPVLKRLSTVLKMTKAHGGILAMYALCYRLLMTIFEKIDGVKDINEFTTGCIAGLLVYGNWHELFNHSITHQITLYCGARVVLALGNMAAHKISKDVADTKVERIQVRRGIQKTSWALFATITWGSVMYLHRFYPQFLQHGLESSMEFIYDDYKWNDLQSLLGF